jgi:hypothetical protein
MPCKAGSAVDSMGWSMDAQATSPAGQSPIDPESRAPTAQGAPGAETAEADLPQSSDGAETPADRSEIGPHSPGFRERGRMRRRARFLHKARELAYRDLGGLVFEMHRLGQRHDELVAAKLSVLANFDSELRALEAALGAGSPVTVLRESGIAACPRCAAIHGSDDHFCPACGMPMGRHADRPIAATAAVNLPGTAVARRSICDGRCPVRAGGCPAHGYRVSFVTACGLPSECATACGTRARCAPAGCGEPAGRGTPIDGDARASCTWVAGARLTGADRGPTGAHASRARPGGAGGGWDPKRFTACASAPAACGR